MVAFSSGTSKYAAAERIVKPRQSMWHCVTVNDATHWNLLNTLNSSICSLTWDIEIMYSIVCRLYHERFNVELLYHCTIMYRARWFSPCRFFAEFIGDANRFCTNRYVRRTMHPPAIQWFWGTTTAACRKRSWAALVAAWKIVWWKHPDQQKIAESKSWYSHISCPSMVFHDSLWNWIDFKLKISPRLCLKSCVSWNLRARRAMDS